MEETAPTETATALPSTGELMLKIAEPGTHSAFHERWQCIICIWSPWKEREIERELLALYGSRGRRWGDGRAS